MLFPYIYLNQYRRQDHFPNNFTMRQIGSLLSLLVLLTGDWLSAQPVFPQADPVFSDSGIPRIDILIDPDSLQAIFDDVNSNHEYPATFIFRSQALNDTLHNIGFRLRGNTSRYSPKKSFKVSFNTFEPGRKFYGLEKMNINGEHNDPSLIRSKLCWDILREINIPASRANHVELYINGDYYGLYINVEHIDEEFVRKRFQNLDGNLYKCLYPADLVYISDHPEDYKFKPEDHRTYDLHTNTQEDDYSDLAHFIDVLNNTPEEELSCELEKIFNVDDWLKIMAFDAVTGNWDNYSYLKNNYYLYHNTSTGRFEFIPYDLDNTLGIDWIGRNWATRDIYDWANRGEDRPLHKRLLGLKKYRDRYSYHINCLITGVMNPDTLFPRIDSIRAMISASVMNDPYYTLSYGYCFDDFLRSYDEALGGHVTHGLKEFVTARIASIGETLQMDNISPVINHINSNHPRLNEAPVITALVEDDDPGVTVEAIYSTEGGPAKTAGMSDDGTLPDRIAGDGIYTAELEPVGSAGEITFRIRASSVSGPENTEPCEGIRILVFESSSPDLVINEFMAGNILTKADEYGEFDDWVELYNRDVTPVWLGDKYLSDDLQDPARWKLPDQVLDPSEFILIWADGQNSQGPAHASFRLNKSGEEIGIFESPERNSAVIDYLAYGVQQDDISYGRSTDGGNDWLAFGNSTPGYSNLATPSAEVRFREEPVRAFPNPVIRGIVYFSRTTSVRLHDLSGRLLLEGKDTERMYIGDLPAGVYILNFPAGNVQKIILSK